MEQFELHESPLEGFEQVFECYLYNTPEFLKANNDLPQKHFYLMDKTAGKYLAHIAFNIENDLAVSPLKAPFGGVEFAEGIHDNALSKFLELLEKRLREQGVIEIRIHQAPDNYTSQETIDKLFHHSGFELIQERVYQGIDIDEIPLSEKMHEMQKRRLRKSERELFVFKKYPKNELAKAFMQIDRWRTMAEKSLSMTWADLHNSSKRNPKAYHAFGLENEHGLMIAGSIVVRVNENVLYHFFPAHYDAYNQFSPMVMLMNGIYDWGRKNGFKHLDLGTSYVHKKVNSNLRTFKERMGAKEYSARSWRKKLN